MTSLQAHLNDGEKNRTTYAGMGVNEGIRHRGRASPTASIFAFLRYDVPSHHQPTSTSPTPPLPSLSAIGKRPSSERCGHIAAGNFELHPGTNHAQANAQAELSSMLGNTPHPRPRPIWFFR